MRCIGYAARIWGHDPSPNGGVPQLRIDECNKTLRDSSGRYTTAGEKRIIFGEGLL